MYAAHFRAAQPALKARYATDTKAAFLTLKAGAPPMRRL
jgi:hypothetical protein